MHTQWGLTPLLCTPTLSLHFTFQHCGILSALLCSSFLPVLTCLLYLVLTDYVYFCCVISAVLRGRMSLCIIVDCCGLSAWIKVHYYYNNNIIISIYDFFKLTGMLFSVYNQNVYMLLRASTLVLFLVRIVKSADNPAMHVRLTPNTHCSNRHHYE